MSGLHGRTLKQKWIAGSNLLLERRQLKALSANKKRHCPPCGANGDFGDLGVARPEEKAASGCGFGGFSRQNCEKGNFGDFIVARVHATVDCQSDHFGPKLLERIARPEALQTNRYPLTGVSASVVL